MSTRRSPWKAIETAPLTALKQIDLLDGGKRRVPDCYWSRFHKKWRSRLYNAAGKRLQVRRPTHWMLVPKPPKSEHEAGAE